MNPLNNGTGPSVIISGIGCYVPSRILTNDDLTRMVDTSDEWIRTRTGIRERRIADENEHTSDMGVKAARKAIDKAGLQPGDIDLVIVATITPDMPFPATACLIQDKLGLRKVPCFDVEAACSGFLYIMDIASHMLRSGNYRHALVIGAEKLSSITDWNDRDTCVLFGDGAGAVVLSCSETPDVGVLGTLLGASGTESEMLYMPGGGSACPSTLDSVNDSQHYLKMAGKEVFKNAVRVMEQSAIEILNRYSIKPESLTCVISHQANIRIIESLSNRLKIPMEKLPMNLDRYGNTSAASIPLVLEEVYQNGGIKTGNYVLMIAFGAGMTWASTLIKWH